jgi:hypothetical protein
MRRPLAYCMALAGAVALLPGTGCGRGRTDAEAQASVEGAPECAAYASDYERCLRSLAPDPAAAERLAENTRLSLQAAVTDEASRIRLNDECRAARAQLRRSCQ